MQRFSLVISAVLTMLVVGAGGVEAQQRAGFNLGAGPTFPNGDDKGTGVHLNAGFGVGLGALPFGLRVEGMAQRIPEGDDHHDYLGGSLNAEIALPLEGARPYLIGGVGAVWHREQHGDHAHDAHTDLAFNVGVGTQFGLLGQRLYVEARYFRLLNGDDDHGHGDDHAGNTFIPLTIGIRF
jgi:hypothetical protein